MSQKYTAEFKREAVRMMIEMGLSVPAVAGKPGVTASQLYAWRKKARLAGEDAFPGSGRLTPVEEENRRLKADVKRLEQERDILKSQCVLCQPDEAIFAWIQKHRTQWTIQLMCKVLDVSRSGYYAWRCRKPGVIR